MGTDPGEHFTAANAQSRSRPACAINDQGPSGVLVRLPAVVVSGRRSAGPTLAAKAMCIKSRLGEEIVPGSLNLILAHPQRFNNATAVLLEGGKRLFWPAILDGTPVWIYRWRGATLHIVEVVSNRHLRNSLNLADGDAVTIEVRFQDVDKLHWSAYLVWSLFWFGRREWFYRSKGYSMFGERLAGALGATQKDEPVWHTLRSRLKKQRTAVQIVRGLRRRIHRPRNFVRNTDVGESGNFALRQVENLLNYAKGSGADYAARAFPAGYHTVAVDGFTLKGQRDPHSRLQTVPLDFSGKTVLDIGCNQGGMLHTLGSQVRWGVGLDYDARLINAANRIKMLNCANHLGFYVFDLEKDPFELIFDLLPEPKVDVVFLLSVCMWIKNWRDLLEFASQLSDMMLFESNGTMEEQAEQIAVLSRLYLSTDQLAGSSDDDPIQKNRQLFLCRR